MKYIVTIGSGVGSGVGSGALLATKVQEPITHVVNCDRLEFDGANVKFYQGADFIAFFQTPASVILQDD